jgi:hypothetical protein
MEVKNMKLNQPPELQNYRYDKKAESRSSLLPRIVGWLTFLSFLFAVYSFIYLKENKSIMMGSIAGFMVLFVLYVIVKILKRRIRCSQCNQNMDVISIKYTPNQWQQYQGYKLIDSFTGADGNLYSTDIEKRKGYATHYFIHSHLHRWYACHQCRSYFLNAKYLRETILSTLSKDEFEKTKNSLVSDPKASEKIELAYKERLQER